MGYSGDGFVYVVRVWLPIIQDYVTKIGGTGDLDGRLKAIRSRARNTRTHCSYLGQDAAPDGREMEVLRIIDCVSYPRVEKYLHNRFYDYRAEVERVGGNGFFFIKEAYRLSEQQIEEICAIDFSNEDAVCSEYEQDWKPTSVSVSGDVYRELEDYVSAQNRQRWPNTERRTRQQITDEALRLYLRQLRTGTYRPRESRMP